MLDVFSRRVVGWSIADHLRTELVVDALQMATWRRRPAGTIIHFDRGTQYTSWASPGRCGSRLLRRHHFQGGLPTTWTTLVSELASARN